MAKINLQEKSDEIIRIAEESGVQSNFFFLERWDENVASFNKKNRIRKLFQNKITKVNL